LMIVVGIVAAKWETIVNYIDRCRRPISASAPSDNGDIEYFCPMRPTVIRTEPGNCPICGMPLSKRTRSAPAPLPAGVLARVQLTPYKVEMGRIGTSPVGYRMLAREIRTVGTIEYDETRVAHASARVKGRLDKLFVNFVGQRVAQGDPLFTIYSPDLV